MVEALTPPQPRKGYGHGGALRRFESIAPRDQPRRLPEDHPAIVEGRTIMPGRVFQPHEVPRLLIDGVNSRKIGKRVTKGRWKGFPIFTLTLEERATCPRTCTEWRTCMGGNMQYARRIAHGADFERRIWAELDEKQRQHPGGFAVRLHVLGDFYSETYVRLWRNALDRFPALHVFGFTARDPAADPIGKALYALAVVRWQRFAVRFSGLDAREGGSVVIERGQPTPHIVCPAQTEAADCCATCALCWHSDRTIAFWRH